MHRRLLLGLAAAALALPALSLAHGFTLGALKIGHPWARPATAGRAGGGYLTVTNTGAAPDALISAASPAAAKVTIHEMSMAGGVMRMRALTSLPVPPGATVTLAPGGYHLMLEGLKRDLKVGDRIPGTLRFAKAGSVAVEFVVQDAPAEAHHDMHM